MDRLVQEIKRMHPNDGERLMIGHLSRFSATVPRPRLRASIHQVDPVGTRARRSITIRRRVTVQKVQMLSGTLTGIIN